MRDDSNQMALELSQYTTANARVEAECIAAALPLVTLAREGLANRAAIGRVLQEHAITLQGGFVVVFRDGKAVAAFNVPRHSGAGDTVKPLFPSPGRRGPRLHRGRPGRAKSGRRLVVHARTR